MKDKLNTLPLLRNLLLLCIKAIESKAAHVFVSSLDGSEMPIWAPPTPPQDDNDVYLDATLFFLYEGNVMSESQLPPVFVRKEHKKPRLEHITTRKQKQRKEEATRIPRSLFDRPSSAIMKQRREQKIQKLVRQSALFKHMGIPMRPPHLPPKTLEQSEGHPEWLIHEDWALLSAVQDLCRLPLNLHVQQNAHQVNWDLVADVVNSVSRTYRSIKQCRARYENTIIPREEGKLLYDVSPRKQKKQKTSYKTKNNRPMKTSQLMTQDNNNSVTLLYSLRFDSIKAIAVKRPPPSRPTLNNPSMKNPKHLAVLQEYNINFDQPLNPVQVAANRAERIAKEKKNAQQTAATEAAQRPAAQAAGATLQTVVGAASQAVVQAITASAAQAISATPLHSLVAVSGTPTTIITGTASRAAIAQGMTAVTIARTLSAPGNIVAVTGGRGISQRVAVHDIGTVAGTVTAAQVVAGQPQARTVLQPSVSASLTQKVAAIAGTSAALTATSVHPGLAAAKSLAHQQINLLRPILRSQAPGTATQAQQLRTQKLSFTYDVLQNKGAMVRAMSHQLSEEQLKALKLQAAQLLQGPLQVGQSGSTAQAPVTLVKSVSAAAGTSGIPIPVTINVTMGGQQKAGMPASRGATVSQLQQQQQQRMLLQHRKGVPIQQSQRVTALSNIRGGQIPLIIPQKAQLTGQLLHQIVKQQQMNSQPAIISVTQGQSLTPMVAKVSLTTGPHTGSIQTLSTIAGTPITVTQVVAAVSTPQAGGVSVTQHTPTMATINMASGSSQATVVKTATLVDPVTASKMANITHSLVSQPLQVVSSPLAQQQGQTVLAATGMQHRLLTAATASIPQGATVVMSSTSPAMLSAPATSAPAACVQQAVIAASPSVLSMMPPSNTISTVVTQTQLQQPQQQTAGVAATAAATQQAAQKPYTMRTRNQPKH